MSARIVAPILRGQGSAMTLSGQLEQALARPPGRAAVALALGGLTR
jgi:hypothetical protein